MTPSTDTSPCVGRNPKIPQYEEGILTDPPVSVPRAKSVIPEAAATADPLEDPPGILSMAQGLTGVP
ncbi:hypothetical protein CHCC14819_4468 [Bacillus licheniformis]|nr:hypothetical protein B4091_3951 [Bacillus licheniformis]TWL84886.1 hypothetical protein CHCC15292_2219 [Bacillus licheniformis]TWM35187.1 hypothetical protein CHCC14819_4468 [Bacillus licheniformis]